MKKILLGFASLLAFAACSNDGETFTTADSVDSFGAVLEEGTRTYLDGLSVKWLAGDKVTVVWGNTPNNSKVFTAKTGGQKSTTLLTERGDGFTTESGPFYGVYGSSATQSSDGSIAITLSSGQIYNPDYLNSFGDNANLMVGKAESVDALQSSGMSFTNLCGVLVVSLYTTSEGWNISDIVLSTNDDTTPLSGNGTIDFSGDTPTLTMNYSGTLTDKIVTMGFSNSNVAIPTSAGEALKAYIVVPAATYTNLTVEVHASNANGASGTATATYNSSKGMNIEANKIMNLRPSAFEFNFDTYSVGDVYPKSGTPVGIVISTTGKNGSVLSLNNIGENGEENGGLLAYYNGSGTAEVPPTEVTAEYPALYALQQYSTKTNMTWSLPSLDEWKVISESIENINEKLTSASGTTLDNMNDDTAYWTSNTSGRGNNIKPTLYYLSDNTNDSDISATAYVRAIAQF